MCRIDELNEIVGFNHHPQINVWSIQSVSFFMFFFMATQLNSTQLSTAQLATKKSSNCYILLIQYSSSYAPSYSLIHHTVSQFFNYININQAVICHLHCIA